MRVGSKRKANAETRALRIWSDDLKKRNFIIQTPVANDKYLRHNQSLFTILAKHPEFTEGRIDILRDIDRKLGRDKRCSSFRWGKQFTECILT